MKNGLLTYKSYNDKFNIGDYIQSLAAAQFFRDEIDIYLNRERLNEYSGEKVKLIMNGWFVHEPQNWPPSKDIVPLFVSFHINSVARNELLKSDSIKYLKKWQPIGCRDKETVRLLTEKGVDSYFSGCLTLTLGESYKSKEKSDNVYFVDPYFEYQKDMLSILVYFLVLLKNCRTICKISTLLFKNKKLKSLIKTVAFYKDYIRIFDSNLLENANYVNHEIKDSNFTSDKEKFNFAEQLLVNYSQARFVVTSRIHCALPCLGMGTPVMYIENVNQSETSFCRLDGLRDFFNIIYYDRGRMHSLFTAPAKKIGFDFPFINKSDYVEYKERLIQTCHDFVSL